MWVNAFLGLFGGQLRRIWMCVFKLMNGWVEGGVDGWRVGGWMDGTRLTKAELEVGLEHQAWKDKSESIYEEPWVPIFKAWIYCGQCLHGGRHDSCSGAGRVELLAQCCKRWVWGIPWQSSGSNSALSLSMAWVQPLIPELRSHKPCDVAKKKKTSLGLGTWSKECSLEELLSTICCVSGRAEQTSSWVLYDHSFT